MTDSVSFRYSGTYKGKAVSGTVSAAPISPSDVATAIYAALTGKADATLERRRNDWACGSYGKGQGYFLHLYDRDRELEAFIRFSREGAASAKPAIQPEALEELQAFAAVEGRNWKAVLEKESWWRGIPARDRKGREYPHLYGLRNTHGPSWLADFRLPA